MMLKGEAPASVQCAALRSLGHVLSAIDTVPPSDAKMFNECAPLLPALVLFTSFHSAAIVHHALQHVWLIERQKAHSKHVCARF